MIPRQIIVAIPDDALRLTQAGLGVAIPRVDWRVKKSFQRPGYSWVDEATDLHGQRWCLIRIQETIENKEGE